MRRILRIALPLGVLAISVASIVACDDDRGIACARDRDCGPGFVCVAQICQSAYPDGGAIPDAAPIGVDVAICSNDGVFCNQPGECCSSTCTQNRCGSTPGNTACKPPLESCLTLSDCCLPSTCDRGLCR